MSPVRASATVTAEDGAALSVNRVDEVPPSATETDVGLARSTGPVAVVTVKLASSVAVRLALSYARACTVYAPAGRSSSVYPYGAVVSVLTSRPLR